MSTQRHAREILDFWFGSRPYAPAGVRQRMRLWFGNPSAPELQPQTDEAIRNAFAAPVADALAGGLSAWADSPRRRLALILLLDQFPRNLQRGKPGAFAGDAAALALATGGIQQGADAALDPVERIFFYMPLQHAESREVQAESVAAFTRLEAEAPEELHEMFTGIRHFAELHRDIVQRFSRFPHRNRTLGRESTPDEEQWLRDAGQHFGQ
jgi:uncharacterized protein (DUF924 family)